MGRPSKVEAGAVEISVRLSPDALREVSAWLNEQYPGGLPREGHDPTWFYMFERLQARARRPDAPFRATRGAVERFVANALVALDQRVGLKPSPGLHAFATIVLELKQALDGRMKISPLEAFETHRRVKDGRQAFVRGADDSHSITQRKLRVGKNTLYKLLKPGEEAAKTIAEAASTLPSGVDYVALVDYDNKTVILEAFPALPEKKGKD